MKQYRRHVVSMLVADRMPVVEAGTILCVSVFVHSVLINEAMCIAVVESHH